MNDIANKIRELRNLCDSGAISETEYVHAKSVLLGATPPQSASIEVDQQIQELQLQTELLRIDQDWICERERYKVRYGKYSSPRLPNLAWTIVTTVAGFAAISFGVFWIQQDFGVGPPAFFKTTGIALAVMGTFISLYHITWYSLYKSAFSHHQRRRLDILARHARV
jgi:hypothetical protein